jgi:hypothetical protein
MQTAFQQNAFQDNAFQIQVFRGSIEIISAPETSDAIGEVFNQTDQGDIGAYHREWKELQKEIKGRIEVTAERSQIKAAGKITPVMRGSINATGSIGKVVAEGYCDESDEDIMQLVLQLAEM